MLLVAHADVGDFVLGRGGILLDLAADVRHVDAQDLIVRLGLGAPDLADEEIVGQHLTGVFAQQRHDLELVEREVNVLPAHENMVLVVVDGQVADRIFSGLRDGVVVKTRARMADSRADAGEQFTRPEGLFDVIVRAEIERRDLVALVRTRGDHDDRHARPGPHLLEHLHAVHVGKTEVKDDQVGTMRRDHRQRLLRAARHKRVEAVGGQNGGHEILDVLLVLDDQYLIPDLHPLFPP